MNGFYVLSGGWAIITLALFVYAITLSYRVEKRSRPAGAHPGLPGPAAAPAGWALLTCVSS